MRHTRADAGARASEIAMQFRQLSLVLAEFEDVRLSLLSLTAIESIREVVEVIVLIGRNEREGESVANAGALLGVVVGFEHVGICGDTRQSFGGEFTVS